MEKEILLEVNRYRELVGLSLLKEGPGPRQVFNLRNALLSIMGKTSGNVKNILTKQNLNNVESKLKTTLDDLNISDILLKIERNTLTDDEFDTVVSSLMRSDDNFYKKILNIYVSSNPAIKKIDDLPKILDDKVKQTGITPSKKDVDDLRKQLLDLIENNNNLGPDVKKIFKDKINSSLSKFESGLGAKIENIKIDPDVKDIKLPTIRTMIGPDYKSVMNMIRPTIDTWIKSGFKKWDESKQNELILDIGKKLSVIVNDYKDLKGFGEARGKIKTLAKDISISLELLGQKAGDVSGIKGQKASYNDLMVSLEKALRENGVERPDEVIDFIKKYDTQPGKSWFIDEVFKESGYAKVWRLGSKDTKVQFDAWYRLIEGLFVTGIFSKSIRQMLQEIKSVSGPNRIGKLIYFIVYMNTVGYLIAESIFTLFYCIFASIGNYFTDENEKKNYGTFVQFYLKELWDEIVQKYSSSALSQFLLPRGGISDNIYDFLNSAAQGKIGSELVNQVNKTSEKYKEIREKYKNATDEQKRKLEEIWNGEGTDEEKLTKTAELFEGKKETTTTQTTTEEIPLEEVQNNLIAQSSEEIYTEFVYKVSYENGKYYVCYNEDCSKYTNIVKNEKGEWICITKNEVTNNKKWPCFRD